MTILLPLIIILVAEYVGDFLLQSRYTALNKSKDIRVLGRHLFEIAIMLCAGFALIPFLLKGVLPLMAVAYFIGWYCLIHGVQDWFIWNGYKYLVYRRVKKAAVEQYKKGNNTKDSIKYVVENKMKSFVTDKEYAEDKAFYDTIGLDRVLHVITLVVLYGVFFL